MTNHMTPLIESAYFATVREIDLISELLVLGIVPAAESEFRREQRRRTEWLSLLDDYGDVIEAVTRIYGGECEWAVVPELAGENDFGTDVLEIEIHLAITYLRDLGVAPLGQCTGTYGRTIFQYDISQVACVMRLAGAV